jgi:FAIM1 (Fas apoptotic inhibitory molecule) protein
MERKAWTVEVDGRPHEVVLQWSYWGGAREVQVDGQTVDRSKVPMRWRSEQSFEVAGHNAIVSTRPSRRISPWFVITLEIDGRDVEPDAGFSRWEAPAG